MDGWEEGKEGWKDGRRHEHAHAYAHAYSHAHANANAHARIHEHLPADSREFSESVANIFATQSRPLFESTTLRQKKMWSIRYCLCARQKIMMGCSARNAEHLCDRGFTPGTCTWKGPRAKGEVVVGWGRRGRGEA